MANIRTCNKHNMIAKSDETEEVNIEEEEASNVKSGETEELDLETTQSTARQGTITPRTLNFEDEAGPSSPLRPTQFMESEEHLKAAEVLVAISRPRGLSIPGPIQSQPQQPVQGTDTQGTDPKDKGKGILVEEPKKKKMTLQQIRALETTNDEEVARKIQAEWDAEEERKRFEELKKTKPKTTLRKPTSLAQERNQMMSFLKGQGYKNLQKLKYPQMKELYDKVQASIKELFSKTLFQWIHRKKGEYRQDLYHLYRVVDDYYEHIPPTGLGLMLLGDLNIIWETAESSDDDFWKDQEEWEIIRWRFHESSGVHTLEIEDGMEVEDESETAITLIHLFILWTTEDGAVADFTNLETVVNVSPIPTSRINPSHPSALILGDPTSAVQKRSKVNKSSEAHSKTKHIAIRHHFIQDAYEKKLIQVLKIHTNDNVADLLTKAFDVSRFQFLVVSIGMINP
ncbi:hypothetical protein Tco_0935067 [Tanacetum coccineum]